MKVTIGWTLEPNTGENDAPVGVGLCKVGDNAVFDGDAEIVVTAVADYNGVDAADDDDDSDDDNDDDDGGDDDNNDNDDDDDDDDDSGGVDDAMKMMIMMWWW